MVIFLYLRYFSVNFSNYYMTDGIRYEQANTYIWETSGEEVSEFSNIDLCSFFSFYSTGKNNFLDLICSQSKFKVNEEDPSSAKDLVAWSLCSNFICYFRRMSKRIPSFPCLAFGDFRHPGHPRKTLIHQPLFWNVAGT